jgi:hypothetical protein
LINFVFRSLLFFANTDIDNAAANTDVDNAKTTNEATIAAITPDANVKPTAKQAIGYKHQLLSLVPVLCQQLLVSLLV